MDQDKCELGYWVKQSYNQGLRSGVILNKLRRIAQIRRLCILIESASLMSKPLGNPRLSLIPLVKNT